MLNLSRHASCHSRKGGCVIQGVTRSSKEAPPEDPESVLVFLAIIETIKKTMKVTNARKYLECLPMQLFPEKTGQQQAHKILSS
eukprot:6128913-Ditylum_brightwellii.AAC.1